MGPADTRTSRAASRLADAAASTPVWQRSMEHLLYGPAAEFMAKGRDWQTTELIRRKLQAADAMLTVLNYVADMTYCGSDAEWHFKQNYDPQCVLDVLAAVGDRTAPAKTETGA